MAIRLGAALQFIWITYAYCIYAPSTISPAVYSASPAPAIASHYQSVLRSIDGNSVISAYGKSVETPHSSVRKYDSRVSNDALVYAHLPSISTYPHYSHGAAAPSLYPRPASYIATKSAPLYAAPTYYTHNSYPFSSPSIHDHIYHSPVYTSSPYHPAAPHYSVNPYLKHLPIHEGVLPYSDAAQVSHISFEGLGTNYAW